MTGHQQLTYLIVVRKMWSICLIRGHGLHIINDPDLIHLVIDNDVTLELCPTSNLLTGSIPAIEDHPFKGLIDAGV